MKLKYINIWIVLLFVSSILIFIKLGSFSASSIFGIGLILHTFFVSPHNLKPKSYIWLLFIFFIIAILSLLFAKTTLYSDDYIIILQTFYWLILSSIIFSYYDKINKKTLSIVILLCVLLLIITYNFFLTQILQQNSVAYSVVLFAPLGIYCIKKKWIKLIVAVSLLFLIFLNGSRSGALIFSVQILLIFIFAFSKKRIKQNLILSVFVLLITTNYTTLRFLGDKIYPYNPSLGILLSETEYILHNDMSWLQRRAQVQKGKQIFKEHPIIGIGYNKFIDYNINIDESKVETDRILRDIDNRSAHNTYINWLSETGIIGFTVMILFFLSIFISYWRSLKKITNSFEAYLFISMLGMLIYFYSISAHLGTSTWIMYGLFAGGAFQLKKQID